MPVSVLSVAQMREWEKATWAAGQTEHEVIRRVGAAIARQVQGMVASGSRILVLAGKGHNGDDAKAAAEWLTDCHLKLVRASDPEIALNELNAALAWQPELIVDGLFGIGLNRPLSAAWLQVIRMINAAQVKTLAVDVPSGLNADTGETFGDAIEAAVTLTVGAPKNGLLAAKAVPYVGRIEIAGAVGLHGKPVETEIKWGLREDFLDFPPRRDAGSHKGDFGHALVVAGSLGYHGAAVLAATGAKRARPGLITVLTQESVYYPVAAQLQAVMVNLWIETSKLPTSADAVLVGPGLAAPEIPPGMKLAVRKMWRDLAVPMVVDASALDWLALEPFAKNAIRVLTPHPGEAARLLMTTAPQVQADRPRALRELSRRCGNCWILLKGRHTLIGRSEGEIFVNPSGNPFLAQGGSGDLLAGYVTGLLAQPALQADVIQTLRFAVWQHGAAADQLSRQSRNWTVEDLAEMMGGLDASDGKRPA